MARALLESQQAQAQAEQGASLMGAQYAPNSGALGSLAMMAQTYAGKKMRGKGEAKALEAGERYGKAKGAAELAEEERKAEREHQAFLRKLEVARSGDPAMAAAMGMTIPERKAPTLVDVPDGRGGTIKMENTPDGLRPIRVASDAQNTPAANAGFKVFRDAIAGIESAGSGDYKAIGPQTKTGDRAYGRYQVMGANIPEWTKAALGREMTPEEFAASPEAQDAVFDHRFGGYVKKYGPEGAAKAWFAGEGGMNNPGARDVLGTSVEEYGRKFSQGMGGTQEAYGDSASGVIGGGLGYSPPKIDDAKPTTVQQRRRDLREIQASGQKVTKGMADHFMLHGKFPDAPKPDTGKPAKGMTGDVANKVGLYSNALRSAREWHSIVAEKDEAGNYTGGYNNMAAMSPQAKTLLNNAIRAKLRAESGASISPDELEGEVERYSARLMGGDQTDIAAANNLLNDLSTQITSLVGKKGQAPANNDDDLIRKYLNP